MQDIVFRVDEVRRRECQKVARRHPDRTARRIKRAGIALVVAGLAITAAIVMTGFSLADDGATSFGDTSFGWAWSLMGVALFIGAHRRARAFVTNRVGEQLSIANGDLCYLFHDRNDASGPNSGYELLIPLSQATWRVDAEGRRITYDPSGVYGRHCADVRAERPRSRAELVAKGPLEEAFEMWDYWEPSLAQALERHGQGGQR